MEEAPPPILFSFAALGVKIMKYPTLLYSVYISSQFHNTGTLLKGFLVA